MPHAMVLNDIRGIARNYDIDLIAIGGIENHIHMLIRLPAKLSLANAVRVIKANSSKWMNETGHFFSWQAGYSAFSVSLSKEKTVAEYIRDQAVHHAKHSFEEEMEGFYAKHGMRFGPEALG